MVESRFYRCNSSCQAKSIVSGAGGALQERPGVTMTRLWRLLGFNGNALHTECDALLWDMIAGFRDAESERLWMTGHSKRLPPRLHRQALKKLYMLNAALALENLMVPPGNRLEKLRGDREGQFSIRVNDRYRICFDWRDGNAHEVEVVDYH